MTFTLKTHSNLVETKKNVRRPTKDSTLKKEHNNANIFPVQARLGLIDHTRVIKKSVRQRTAK